MLSFPLIYHHGYDLHFGDHVFPSVKYKLIRERMLREGFAAEADFLEPLPASDEDLMLVHDRGWVHRLKHGTLSYHEILQLEVPYSRPMVDAFWLAAGGTTLAARCALKSRVGFNIGGGFHHAFPGHGEGFCAIHDVAAAIRILQKEKLIERALVVDVDVHQGNGTAAIFANDPAVYTLSIHQFNNYPAVKPPSTVDIHLADNIGDAEYMANLRGPLEAAFEEFRPQLLMYVAGADPYEQDKLGGLSLTMDGLFKRDLMVMETAISRNVPVCVTLAGGYAQKLDDTVAIHCNTAKAAGQALGRTLGCTA